MIPFADLLVKINLKPEAQPVALPVKQYEIAMLFSSEFKRPDDALTDMPAKQMAVHLKKLADKGVIERKRIGSSELVRYAYRLIIDKSLISKSRENRINEVISLISKHPGINMGGLAKKMGTSYEGPRYYIDTLVKKGIIRRTATVSKAKSNGSRSYKFYPMVVA